MSVYKEEKF